MAGIGNLLCGQLVIWYETQLSTFSIIFGFSINKSESIGVATQGHVGFGIYGHAVRADVIVHPTVDPVF